MITAQPLDNLCRRLAHMDLSAAELLRIAGQTIDRDGIAYDVQRDLNDRTLPAVSAAATATIPLPPVSAVLITIVFLGYIGQSQDNVVDLFWSLQHYWKSDDAAALGIADWQRTLDAASPTAPITDEGVGNLIRWLEAIVDVIGATGP